MKATIIKVSMIEGKGYDAMKPLLFGIMDTITPKDVEMEYFDERVEELPEQIDSDIISLSVETFAARRAYKLAKKYKTKNNIIVMGGFHPTMLPEEALEYCDVVLIGDAEDTWPDLINDYKKGKIKKIYKSSNKTNIAKIDFNSKVYYGKKYNKIGLVQFSRGCKFNCDFCSIRSFYKSKVRQKSLEDTIEEIRNIKEKLIFFIDDNIFLDEKSALALFKSIQPLKKKWACQISMDVAFNDKLLKSMKESGCILVLMGFESLNSKNLKLMNKSANLNIKKYEEAIKNIYKHKIMIYGTFVLGYDYDTKEDIKKTMEFAIKNNLTIANFNPLIPMPGTRLYKRLEDNKELIYNKWWLEENFCYGDSAYYPKNMSPEDLKEGCKEARYTFNTYKNIFKRLICNKCHLNPFNILIFLILNIISRKEIHRKQGKKLGGK
ncbi:MAG: radical SAM protein [Bacilli bacterium]|nr:radical SAM protein [Bacilli bacterium]